MKVADLSADELKVLIRETVAESLADLLADPDAGLEPQTLPLSQRRRAFEKGSKAEAAFFATHQPRVQTTPFRANGSLQSSKTQYVQV